MAFRDEIAAHLLGTLYEISIEGVPFLNRILSDLPFDLTCTYLHL